MIFKREDSTNEVALRHKNLFVLNTDTDLSGDKTMLMRGRGEPIYSLSSNPQIRLWHHRLGHASNTRVIQISKLVDGINLREIIGPVDNPHSSDSELEFDSDSDKPSSIDKAIELNIDSVEKLCEACIKSKHTRIVKSKRMTLTMIRLQEI